MMAFSLRRLGAISKIFPRYFQSGTLNEHYWHNFLFRGLSVIPLHHAHEKISRSLVEKCSRLQLFSTLPETSQQGSFEVDFLTFFKSTLDDTEGPCHCWLNKIEVKEEPFSRFGTFLVFANAFLEDPTTFDRDNMLLFERIKWLQQRYPALHIFVLQSGSSVASQRCIVQTIMKNHITFPILLSNKKLSEMKKGPFYLLFKDLRSPLLYYDWSVELEKITGAIEEFSSSNGEHSEKARKLKNSWIKQPDLIKEPYIRHFQNLLFYFPGCISVDEDGDRLFLSDTNHHRIIIVSGRGNILDCIGSSPGFEDGEFELAKLFRPAASFYHADKDCLYIVDSENHAVRRADMGKRILETLHPIGYTNKKISGAWGWILDRLGMKVKSSPESEEIDLEPLVFPWHLMLLRENNLLILNRSLQTLWIMDSTSGKMKEVVTGFPKILDICEEAIAKKVSMLNQIFQNQSKHRVDPRDSLDGASLMSTVATFQNDIVFCDTVLQMVLKQNKESGVISNFKFSNCGVLGLPYWMTYPLEKVVIGTDVYQRPCDHLQCLSVLPGRCDIQVKVEIPVDVELATPLQEGCIWRQARGSATEVSGSGNLHTSIEKVIICAVLYLRLNKDQICNEDNQEKKTKRILDILEDGRCGKWERDACISLMLDSGRDLENLVFMKPLHLRLKLECADHSTTPIQTKEVILTESTVEVNVSI
ncbi:hypothetical protein GIB67_022957 [Kingdonia uniflora]|uniref:NHL repeat-containing protein 2 n=1 Tax=Kingdonia uniflora TaxID=39325 RepID=A0A7J7P352_9MAGN|nr:hypothetical protein GIB67_022957 [Kingdonia uniflora]